MIAPERHSSVGWAVIGFQGLCYSSNSMTPAGRRAELRLARFDLLDPPPYAAIVNTNAKTFAGLYDHTTVERP